MTNILREYLVAIGFDVDAGSYDKFNKSLLSATKRVTALYAAVKVAAATVAFGIAKMSESFETLGYELRMVAPSINRVLMLRREMLRSYQAAGVNLRQVVQQSIKFNLSIEKTKIAFRALFMSTASRFFPMLTQQLDTLRARLYANMPRIQAGLEKFVKIVFRAFDATVLLGMRVWSVLGRIWDMFKKLDEVTSGWSTKILAFAAAWQVLNLAFLASPLGMVLLGLAAILALYDDYMTFQEGGESFFDWSAVAPYIKQAVEWLSQLVPLLEQGAKKLSENLTGYKDIAKTLYEIVSIAFQWFVLMKDIKDIDFSGFKMSFGGVLDWLLLKLGDLWTMMNRIQGLYQDFFKGLTQGNLFDFDVIGYWANRLTDLVGGQQTATAGGPQLGGPSVSSTRQTVNQATTINVNGAADAQTTGAAVASQQNAVNRNLTRNLAPRVK